MSATDTSPEMLLATAEGSFALAGAYECLADMADGRGAAAHAAQDRAYAEQCRQRGRELSRRALGLQLAASLNTEEEAA